MVASISGELTSLRSQLGVRTPGEQKSDDDMGDLADSAGHAMVRSETASPPRVAHGETGPAGDNSDPDAATADGVGSTRGSVAFDEADGRHRAGLN
ncbi:hypothetical protein [Sphingomonas sp. Y38-1Y]|uniref:hypothetical protein n=1 Tax=Sphingomonas sp. Y38-1Y TaxID=3078265 RepID=UPI0028EED8DE|nr:hypothetical protein [Sphingomonas sp. Y38-1Y]